MKTSSAKAKGRNLQKYVRDKILNMFPVLTADDVRSTSMGAGGEDILLSSAGRKLLPISIECKSNARHAVYSLYAQATANAGTHEGVLVVKQNNSKPLAVVDLDYLLTLISKQNG